MIEFNYECASEEDIMIWYFWDGLRLLIRVQIEQCGWKLNRFEELVKKAVNEKAKSTLWARSHACETN